MPFADISSVDLRTSCPDLGRLLDRSFTVFVEGGATMHTDADCFAGTPSLAVIATVGHDTLCKDCAGTERRDAAMVQGLADHLAMLWGPLPFDDIWSLNDLVLVCREYLWAADGIRGLFQWYGHELTTAIWDFALAGQDRWDQWFRSEEARIVCAYARCGGTAVTVGPNDADTSGVVGPNLTATPEPAAVVSHIIDLLVEAYRDGTTDPVGWVVDQALDQPDLLTGARDGGALRRELRAMAAAIDAHTAPAADDEDRTVVVASTELWRRMFWTEALVCCFPHHSVSGVEAVRMFCLPKVVADKVAATAAQLGGSYRAAHLSPHLPEADALAVAATAAALRGDGLGLHDALSTALAVNC